MLVETFNRMLDEIESSQRERADLLVREQEANRLKDEFLATLSHELRTPLNAIVGWVHLLRSGQLPEEERRHAIDRIDRNAHAQAKLVQDLLDVSRITTGKLHLDIRDIDLGAVANNAIDACRPAADARQVGIVTQFTAARSRPGRSRSAATGGVEPALERRAVYADWRARDGVARAHRGVRHAARA